MQHREGLVIVPGAAFGNPIYSVTRFDDATPFADDPNLYVIGAGGHLYLGSINGPFPQVDTGYSGDPLSFVSATPPQSPQPWLFVADEDRMRKLDANGNIFQFGIAAPTGEPTSVLQSLGINVVWRFVPLGGPPVTTVGTYTTSTLAVVARVNTTVDQHLFDDGAAPGYVSIVPVSMAGINAPMLLTVNGDTANPMAVQATTIAVTATTIQAILYDAGSTGLCSIQPVGSLGTGQLTGHTIRDQFAAAGIAYAVPRGTEASGPGLPTAPDPKGSLTFIQPDFPVNCLISLGNTETVRILSVAVGRDGLQSFRCKTTSTHVAGESIVGLPAFRGYRATDIANGNTLVDYTQPFTITPPEVPDTAPEGTVAQATGGIRVFFPAGANLAQINGRATRPDDDIYVAIKASRAGQLNTVRVYLSVEPLTGPIQPTDFTQNYFFFEWRQSDIAAAIQNVNTQDVATIQQVRATVVSNDQLNAQTGTAVHRSATGAKRDPHPTPADQAASQQLALGNNQWLAMHCKVRDLIRIGTDSTKTLANITGAEVLVNIHEDTAVDLVVDGVWLAGGYDLEVSGAGSPMVYRSRYRSSVTGGRSNPSPQVRAGIIPQRQAILVTSVQSNDSQVDLVDWFRFGGSLARWAYVRTVRIPT